MILSGYLRRNTYFQYVKYTKHRSAGLFNLFQSPPDSTSTRNLSCLTWYVEIASEAISLEQQSTPSHNTNQTLEPVSRSIRSNHAKHRQQGTSRLLGLE